MNKIHDLLYFGMGPDSYKDREGFIGKLAKKFPNSKVERDDDPYEVYRISIEDVDEGVYFPWIISEGMAGASLLLGIADGTTSEIDKILKWIEEAKLSISQKEGKL